MTLEDIQARHPDILLPPAPEFVDSYQKRVEFGQQAAKDLRVAFLAICRNAMPWLPMTMHHVEQTGIRFKEWKCFVFENDSIDGTKDELSRLCKLSDRLSCSMIDNGRPHLNSTKSSDRTIPLAEYRNACIAWAAENASNYDYAIVFDTDPWGGWSADGVLTTIGYLEDRLDVVDGDPAARWHAAAGMGSYSWCEWGPPVWKHPTICHYDGWACRWTWDSEHQPWPYNPVWFHYWHPPVGSPPVRMNSCFGQLGVYRMRNYLQGKYLGGDCEHVAHWRSCGGNCYLNPSQRVVSFWIPRDDAEKDVGERHGMHRDVHEDVVSRDADQDHRRDAENLGGQV